MIIEIGRDGLYFSWRGRREPDSPTRYRQRGISIDMTGGPQANEEMLWGLFFGDYPGMQLASPLVYVPVTMLIQFMGVPTPQSDDAATQEALDEIMAPNFLKAQQTHISSLVTGNAWRYPRYDAARGKLVWASYRDSAISDLLIDAESGELREILMDEFLTISTGESSTINAERKRRFSLQAVETRWVGSRPAGADDRVLRNVAGVLPVNLGNEMVDGEHRGHSMFCRVIRDLKNYHDIDYRIASTLSRFRVKQKQKLRNNPNALSDWLTNNFGSTDRNALQDYDVAEADLIFNIGQEEDTEYAFLPGDATTAAEKALNRTFYKVVEGTNTPELFYGPLAQGNHASVDTSLDQAVKAAQAKRQGLTPAWTTFLRGCLNVLGEARMRQYGEFRVEWNRLESVSPQVKAQILQQFADACVKLVASCAVTPKQLFKLWEGNFPEYSPGKYEEFIKGIVKTARLKQFGALDYASGADDFAGGESELEKGLLEDEA